MNLSAEETQRFYRIWLPLLSYVNTHRQVIPELGAISEQRPISSEEAIQIRQVLWESDLLRETFIAENPANLTDADLAIVGSWSHRIAGKFYVMRYLKKYAVFLTEKDPPRAYGVLGLASPLEEIILWPLPVYLDAVLLPFEDKIIYDSLLYPYAITFGKGIRSSLNSAYRKAQERGGIITTLRPRSPEEIRQDMTEGNRKVLTAFRKDLAASHLSLNMVEEHTGQIERFMESYLLAKNPPSSLLDLNLGDLQKYLKNQGKKVNRVSFKRLVRFLCNTDRISWDEAEAMRAFLQQR
jgi:hypothetical protein